MKFLTAVVLGCCIACAAVAQGVRVAELKPRHLSYTPVSYYISSVVDDRADRSAVGRLKNNGKTDKVDIRGGAVSGLTAFLNSNVTQDRSKQPVILHITRLSFDMKSSGGGWSSEADVAFTFYAGDIKLIELSAKGKKEGDDDPVGYVDEFLKRMLESNLKKFDGWWQQNGSKVPTATTIKVVPVIGSRSSKPDQIAYSPARPLAISDFEGAVEGDIAELAATLSGIGMESSAVTENGQVILTITLTPYFSRKGSWFKEEGRNPRVLAHEQNHFDITAVKAYELARKLRTMTFSRDNYDREIQDELNRNAEETNREQAKFDEETGHGTNRDKELEWELRTKERLKALGCR